MADDQFGVRRLLVDIFHEDQHEVETAKGGVQALKSLITFKPDLILMDMQILVINGIEILEKIQVSGCRVDVIIMTDYGNFQNMEQVKGLGIPHYINKPFDVFNLRNQVNEILN